MTLILEEGFDAPGYENPWVKTVEGTSMITIVPTVARNRVLEIVHVEGDLTYTKIDLGSGGHAKTNTRLEFYLVSESLGLAQLFHLAFGSDDGDNIAWILTVQRVTTNLRIILIADLDGMGQALVYTSANLLIIGKTLVFDVGWDSINNKVALRINGNEVFTTTLAGGPTEIRYIGLGTNLGTNKSFTARYDNIKISDSGPYGALSGSIWIEEESIAYIDSNGDKNLITGSLVENQPTALTGCIWVEDDDLHYIDENQDERRLFGSDEGAVTGLIGCLWFDNIEDRIAWIDASSHKRYHNIGIDPATVSTLTAYYKADGEVYEDVGKTDPAENNDVVLVWDDSKDTIDLIPGSGPTFKQNQIAGYPAISFPGSKYLVNASGNLGTLIDVDGSTVFIVCKPGALTSGSNLYQNGALFHGADGTLPFGIVTKSPDLVGFYANDTASSATYKTVTKSGIAVDTPCIIIARHDGSDIYLGIDDPTISEMATATCGNLLAAALTSGFRTGFGFDTFLNGLIAEIIVYDSALSEETMQGIVRYLGSKYGIPVSF